MLGSPWDLEVCARVCVRGLIGLNWIRINWWLLGQPSLGIFRTTGCGPCRPRMAGNLSAPALPFTILLEGEERTRPPLGLPVALPSAYPGSSAHLALTGRRTRSHRALYSCLYLSWLARPGGCALMSCRWCCVAEATNRSCSLTYEQQEHSPPPKRSGAPVPTSERPGRSVDHWRPLELAGEVEEERERWGR